MKQQHIVDKIKNVPRYKFSEHSNKDLFEFIKKADKSNKFSNLNAYNYFKEILPMNDDLKKELGYQRQYETIDITPNNIEINRQCEISNALLPEYSVCELETNSNHDQTAVDDVVHAIKENLEGQKHVSNFVVNKLPSSNLELEQIFIALSIKLSHEEIIDFGLSLNSTIIRNYSIISYYIRHLLLKQISQEFSDSMLNIMNDFTTKYMDIFIDEMSQHLLQLEKSSPKVLCQFLSRLNRGFNAKLFRSFIFGCENLKDYHLAVIDILMNSDVDYDSFNKLVDLMLISALAYNSNKTYGKLLLNIIKYLGKNVILLEQPLKHIINSHKSIWSTKILKTFNDSIQDCSMSMTQSFRY